MKKTIALLICITLSLSFTACSQSETKSSVDTANSLNTGYQDFFYDQSPIIKTEDGYYFFGNSSTNLMFYDAKTEEIVPLCNRINCDHNNTGCDASYDNFLHTSISYYNSNLYLVGYSVDINNVITCSLFKISKDGSVREKLCDLCHTSGESIGIQIVINSGYAYYALNSGDLISPNGDKCVLYRMKLDNSEEIEVLYEGEGFGASFSRLKIYNNILYFQMGAYTDAEGNGYSGDIYAYDIAENTFSKVVENVYRDYSVIENELYYDDIENVKCYNLQTKETYTFFDEGSGCISWDGKYIYLDNWASFDYDNDYTKRTIQVFNEDKEMIDEISLPYYDQCLFGDETHMFAYIDDEYGNRVISILDKAQIGTGQCSWVPIE